jgi:hypothetical protein
MGIGQEMNMPILIILLAIFCPWLLVAIAVPWLIFQGFKAIEWLRK